MKISYFIDSYTIFTACGPSKENVDLIVINSNTYIVDGNFSNTEAFAVDSDNLMEVPIEEVPRIKVEQTFIARKRAN